MTRRRLEVSCPYVLLDEAGAPRWRQETVQSAADMERVIQAITAAMTGARYSEKEAFAGHLAVEEALVNAHKHGHQGDWSRPIVVRHQVGAEGVVAQVEDRGPGFDPEQVPDPLDPSNLERPCGRGLLLMRTYLHGVCHNERGNHICLCKHHAEPRPQEGTSDIGGSEPGVVVGVEVHPAHHHTPRATRRFFDVHGPSVAQPLPRPGACPERLPAHLSSRVG